MAQVKVEKAAETEEQSPAQYRRWLILLGTGLVVVVLDQLTKHRVAASLTPGVPWNPIDWLYKYVTFTYVTNTGASFGLFPALGGFFSVVNAIVAVAIILYTRQVPGGRLSLYGVLGLQLGGALGNLVDRIRLGYVIDFIDIKVWPVFNIADSAVVVGTILLAIMIIWGGELGPERSETTGDVETKD